MAVCGTDQGSVVCLDASSGAELCVLYQFQYTDRVTHISIIESQGRTLLFMICCERCPKGNRTYLAEVEMSSAEWTVF